MPPRPVPRLLLALVLGGVTGCAGQAPERAPVERRPVAAVAGTAAPAGAAATPAPPPTAPAPVPVVRVGDGVLHVVPGRSGVAGSGPLTTYVVEVEGGLGIDPQEFATAVDRTLADPRSWGAGGRRSMQRVDGGDVDLRVALASPRTTDRLCAPLDTGGYFSCANGARAVVNAARWLTGAPTYEGRLATYRQYVVNHEVGHTLGFGHEDCPGRGRPAPVMVQQSKSLGGCAQNPWPHP